MVKHQTMKRQNILTIILFLFFTNFIQAQIEDVTWATCIGGEPSEKKSRATATDSNGNIYITGYFDKTIIFGDIVLTSSSFSNIYLAKYNSSGTVMWAKSFNSGETIDNGFSVATDTVGNIYMSGSFNGPNLVLGSITLTQSSGFSSHFVAKMDSDGNAIWGRIISSFSGSLAEKNNDITVDSNGAVIMAGNYRGNCKINNNEISSQGVGSYIIKYDTEGNLLWYKYPTGITTIRAVAIDNSDNIYFTGENISTMSLGSNNFTSGGVFTGKYDAAGNLAWLKQGIRDFSVMGSGLVCSFDINADAAGNSVITGSYSGSISFGEYTFTEPVQQLVPPVNSSFIVKYDNSGNVIWAKKATAKPLLDMNTHVSATKAQFDNNNNIYICGYANTEITLDNIILTQGNDLNSKMYIARYNSQGIVDWATIVTPSRFFTTENYLGLIFENNNLILSGMCYNNTTIGNNTFTEGGIFIAKISAPVLSNLDFEKNNSITIYPNPAKNDITINSINDFNTVNIYNTMGQLVKSFSNINKSYYNSDISELQSGYYIIETVSEKNKTQQNFIKL
ncbi:Beta-propeller repeat protein [compost metagenome]